MTEREKMEIERAAWKALGLAIPSPCASMQNSVTLGTFVFANFGEIGEKGKEAAPQLTEDRDCAKETKACQP